MSDRAGSESSPENPPAVLYVTSSLPWPATSGGRRRAAANIEALASVTSLRVLALPDARLPSNERPDVVAPAASVETLLVPRASGVAKWTARFFSLLGGTNTYAVRSWKVFAEALAGPLRDWRNATHIVLEFPFYTWNLGELRAVFPAAKIMGDVDGDRVAILRRTIRTHPSWREKANLALRLRSLERGERNVRRLDQAWMASPDERASLRDRYPELAVALIPNVVPFDELATYHHITPEPRSALFIGMLDYGPNVSAALRFIGGVAPRVRKTVPHARFAVAGHAPDATVREAARRHNVEVMADVPDAYSVMRSFSVQVVPLEFGGGTRLKILEAAALGTPVVTTRAGLGTLPLTHGRDVLVAESDEDLAAAVVRLWEDPAKSTALAASALEVVRRRFTLVALQKAMLEAIRELDSSQPTTPH